MSSSVLEDSCRIYIQKSKYQLIIIDKQALLKRQTMVKI